MKKSDLERKFHELLERRREALLRAARKGDEPAAMTLYGEICGIADAMRAAALVDWEQAQYIREQAWALYAGKGPDDETC